MWNWTADRNKLPATKKWNNWNRTTTNLTRKSETWKWKSARLQNKGKSYSSQQRQLPMKKLYCCQWENPRNRQAPKQTGKQGKQTGRPKSTITWETACHPPRRFKLLWHPGAPDDLSKSTSPESASTHTKRCQGLGPRQLYPASRRHCSPPVRR